MELSAAARSRAGRGAGSERRAPGELSPEAQEVVAKLKSRDREVRAHEQAHLAAAGGYAQGGMHLSFQTGPDGGRYAVGGEVEIDTSPVPDDPEATIQKAQVVEQAALAPARPSAQDRRVAALASRMEAEARQELSEMRRDEGEVAGSVPETAPAVGPEERGGAEEEVVAGGETQGIRSAGSSGQGRTDQGVGQALDLVI